MKVTLTGWNTGLKKVSLTQAITAHTGLRLSPAKKMVDDLLDGKAVSLEFESVEKAGEFKQIAESLGAICKE